MVEEIDQDINLSGGCQPHRLLSITRESWGPNVHDMYIWRPCLQLADNKLEQTLAIRKK